MAATNTRSHSRGSSRSTVPKRLKKGMMMVKMADPMTAISKNLLDRNPTLKALRFSDLQFHTTNSSCSVALVKAIVLACANFRDVNSPGSK